MCLATDTPGAQPRTVELNLDEYVSSSSSSSNGGGDSGSSTAAAGQAGPLVAKSYKNLDQLAQQVNRALADITAAAVGGSSSGVKRKSPTSAEAGKQQGEAGRSANPGQQGSRPAQPQQPQQQEPDPDYDPLRIGPPRRPLRVGECPPVCWNGSGGSVQPATMNAGFFCKAALRESSCHCSHLAAQLAHAYSQAFALPRHTPQVSARGVVQWWMMWPVFGAWAPGCVWHVTWPTSPAATRNAI